MSEIMPTFAKIEKFQFTMLSQIIRQNFDFYRERNGQTVADLAAARGVTRQTIYSYFRDGCTLATLQKVADLVGVEPWQLLTDPAQHKENQFRTILICPHCGKPLHVGIVTPEE